MSANFKTFGLPKTGLSQKSHSSIIPRPEVILLSIISFSAKVLLFVIFLSIFSLFFEFSPMLCIWMMFSFSGSTLLMSNTGTTLLIKPPLTSLSNLVFTVGVVIPVSLDICLNHFLPSPNRDFKITTSFSSN